MRAITASMLVLLSLGGMTAYAANSQQERMTQCNAQAADKKLAGDARKSFMKSCLSGEAPAASDNLTAQQRKMKQCNADAKQQHLAGDARKSFMKTCLSGS